MTSKYIKVEGHPGLIKDTVTNTLLNVDKETIRQKKAELRMLKKKNEEIESLKNDVSELKSMLHQLLEKNSNG
jgi:broad-specificity NMP kinase